MSIYSTWLDLQHPDDWERDLNAAGIKTGTIGDDSEARGLGSPYLYDGSHVLPTADSPRGGWVEVAAIPNHVAAYRAGERSADEDRLAKHRVDFLRLGLHDAVGGGSVLLDRAQVEALRDTLTAWLDAEVRW